MKSRFAGRGTDFISSEHSEDFIRAEAKDFIAQSAISFNLQGFALI